MSYKITILGVHKMSQYKKCQKDLTKNIDGCRIGTSFGNSKASVAKNNF